MEQDILEQIKQTDEFRFFLATHRYGWSHEQWLELIQQLREKLNYQDIDEHKVGVELEKRKFLLNELRNDAHFRTFLKKNPQGWNHKAWVHFLQGAHNRGYDELDEALIGMALEQDKQLHKEIDFNIKIAGAAGEGVLGCGVRFAKICMVSHLNVFSTAIYPSLIRGGHNHLDVRASTHKINTHRKDVDLLLALNQDGINFHLDKLTHGAGIVCDTSLTIDESRLAGKDIKIFKIPLKEIGRSHGKLVFFNSVAIGAVAAITGVEFKILEEILRKEFAKKGEEIIDKNIHSAIDGYEYVLKNFDHLNFEHKLVTLPGKKRMFITGNEAAALGCIKSGVKFMASYPMTPGTSILINIAKWMKDYGIVVKQTEDELAAMNMIIGGAMTGARCVAVTSGGGLALMGEAFGMGINMELPIVVIDAQRPGPSSGMATQTGQGDLRFALHLSQDEAPRFLFAPGDPEDCFYLIPELFNLAEKYQMPAIVLTDKYLAESHWTYEPFDQYRVEIKRSGFISQEELNTMQPKEYKRYKFTEDNISPRAVPGMANGMHVASSYVHDEHGRECEDGENKKRVTYKLANKLKQAAKEITGYNFYGPEDAETTIVSWGSSKSAIQSALEVLEKRGLKANFLQITFISPLPVEKIEELRKKAKKFILVEQNYTAQLGRVIREETGIEFNNNVLRYDGYPFAFEDLALELEEIMRGGN